MFTIYRSSDGSAPTLNGTAGSLVALLDACLVTGYGAKTAAGWSKPYTGTNKAAFQLGGSIPMLLRVDDNAPATAKEARITGYESMTDVDTGTNPFPTAAQGVGGIAMLVARKSATADSTARDWLVIADAISAYVFIASGDVVGDYKAFFFGEIFSFQANDNYRVMIIGRTSENTASVTVENIGDGEQNIGTASSGHFIARGHTWLAGSVNVGKHGDSAKTAAGGLLRGELLAYTNPEDGKVYMAPVWVHDPNTLPARGLRGRMRGMWHFLHPVGSVNDGDTISGTGELAGKDFMFVKKCYGFNSIEAIAIGIETSDTLETN